MGRTTPVARPRVRGLEHWRIGEKRPADQENPQSVTVAPCAMDGNQPCAALEKVARFGLPSSQFSIILRDELHSNAINTKQQP